MNIRNIAIIAHVDHGKTTLVDKLFSAAGTLGRQQEGSDRIMDNDDKNIQKPASESVVTLTKVSHRYANNRVLDNISISLPAGKMVGFIALMA